MMNQEMTKKEMESKLNEKEIKEFETLIRLGDSEKLAFETVIKYRSKAKSSAYYEAYCL